MQVFRDFSDTLFHYVDYLHSESKNSRMMSKYGYSKIEMLDDKLSSCLYSLRCQFLIIKRRKKIDSSFIDNNTNVTSIYNNLLWNIALKENKRKIVIETKEDYLKQRALLFSVYYSCREILYNNSNSKIHIDRNTKNIMFLDDFDDHVHSIENKDKKQVVFKTEITQEYLRNSLSMVYYKKYASIYFDYCVKYGCLENDYLKKYSPLIMTKNTNIELTFSFELNKFIKASVIFSKMLPITKTISLLKKEFPRQSTIFS